MTDLNTLSEASSKGVGPIRSARTSAGEKRNGARVVSWLGLTVICLSAVAWHARSEFPIDFPSGQRALPRFAVEVNSATEGELLALPDVGPTMAKRIVAYRDQQGPFNSLDDLQHVPGIGPQTLKNLAPYLHFAPRNGQDR